MFASVWQLLSALFITSALLKLVYKLIEGSGAPAEPQPTGSLQAFAHPQVHLQALQANPTRHGQSGENLRTGDQLRAHLESPPRGEHEHHGQAHLSSSGPQSSIKWMFSFFCLAHKLSRYIILLICSLLDAIEGIEWPPSEHEEPAKRGPSNQKKTGQEAGATLGAQRPSNYFDRHYLSRRSLSALLLDQQEEEGGEREEEEGDEEEEKWVVAS